jgi:anaerobic ribonucleoside-triphosphate reductase activating protein
MIRLGHPASSLVVGRHNGPGLRALMWVQGCSHRCTLRCLNPQYLSQKGGFLLPVDELVDHIAALARHYSDLEGITVLGGEPFEQDSALAKLAEGVRALGLSTMAYSGHPMEKLEGSAALAKLDVLVDGPFLPEFAEPTLVWRGSSNQQVRALSDRYTPDELVAAMAEQGRSVSLSGTLSGGVQQASGAQNPEVASHHRTRLHDRPHRLR